MILLAHPFGNANVRAVLSALEGANLLARFVTTVGYAKDATLLSFLPASARRRSYELPTARVKAYPAREVVRLLAVALGIPIRHERGWASIDRVWQELDARAARYFCANKQRQRIEAVYAYEDCALRLFTAARALGVRRVYDLPIAYYETAQRILREEAERYPDWEPTLGGTRDSDEKLARKRHELELADLVICPSNFVFDSIPEATRQAKPCVVIPFGSPARELERVPEQRSRPLRVLFAGALTQRKGLADLFAACRLIGAGEIELVVMGSLLRPLRWYRERLADFTYEPPRSHSEVLRLMRSCDVFVLPSLVEGRALVQQEAMASGLPLIATRNAGGDDLIEEGVTGFLVPIRSPEALAEKLSWCAAHREATSGMGIAAQERAAQLTWKGYGDKIVAAIQNLTGA
ncbi:MAG: glycosyltransferase family 4 protein [Chthoniobacterales bacterium]